MGGLISALRGQRAEAAEPQADEDTSGLDYTALTKASKLPVNPGAAHGKKRAGNKESQKRRKRQKRENDMLCVKQAGLAVPSLKDALKKVSEGSSAPIPSLKDALREVAQGSSSSSSSAPAAVQTPGPVPVPDAALLAGRPAPVSYDDIADGVITPAEPRPAPATARPASASSAPARKDSRVAAAFGRISKDSVRRVRAAQAANARSVFITNLPFKATEEEIRKWLEPGGPIKALKLTRDKNTTKVRGFGHVQFESAEAAATAVTRCDKVELHGRSLRIALVTGEKFQFELPQEIKDDIRGLMKEAYEGMNISTIKDAWQKRHPGQKLDTSKWGFRNFSTAMKTMEGLKLEHHLEKSLTYLAFFDGSDAHRKFLEEKKQKPAEPTVKPKASSKRAAAEADVLQEAKRAKVQ